MIFQPPLPSRYARLTEGELCQAIAERKKQLDGRVVILGHHYQQHEVIQFADFTGDSLKLAQIGATLQDADCIVFCGVHFMAESADILTGDHVRVVLPDLSAGCSMADMADIDQVEEAWDFFEEVVAGDLVPITYVNSSAAIKAFCGARGGACCTSSNARSVLEWAFRQGDKVLFLPDQHLGRNTAYAMGIPLDRMAVYDPKLRDGGLSEEQVKNSRVLLWKGHCSVHALFTRKQCEDIHRNDPSCKILVHPECAWEVVQAADLVGSTECIIRTIDDAPPGSRWAIGTEVHLVDRLIQAHPEKNIRSLAGIQCLCTTMYRIDLKHLLWVLDELAQGRVPNQIKVDSEISELAQLALGRMLDHVSSQPVGIGSSCDTDDLMGGMPTLA